MLTLGCVEFGDGSCLRSPPSRLGSVRFLVRGRVWDIRFLLASPSESESAPYHRLSLSLPVLGIERIAAP